MAANTKGTYICRMLDNALRLALRNFSTLFLLVATIVLPLHLLYGVVFRDVMAVYDVAGQIQSAPVGSVTSSDVDNARLAFWALSAVEIGLVPFAVGAVRRVIETDQRGDVPTVWDALRNARGGTTQLREDLDRERWKDLIAALLAALVAGFVVERMGLLFVGFAPANLRFAVVALVQTAARACAAPFFLVTLARASTPAGRARAGIAEDRVEQAGHSHTRGRRKGRPSRRGDHQRSRGARARRKLLGARRPAQGRRPQDP